jgi:hypothetical protein
MPCGRRWPTWCGRRTPVSAADHRTVGELLADSEELARETLLDATPDQALAMVRSWSQLVGSAAELWAVLPSTPDSPSGLDPMELLRAVGEAIGRSVTAGHWPGQGADRRTPDGDRPHPLPRAASRRTARPPFAAGGPGNTARHLRFSRSGDAHLVCGSTRDRCRTTHDPKDLREHFEIDRSNVAVGAWPRRDQRPWQVRELRLSSSLGRP